MIRIDELKVALPSKPMADTAVNDVGKKWAEIASLYRSHGDDDAAAEWYRNGATWSQQCGDILGCLGPGQAIAQAAPQRVSREGPLRQALEARRLGELPDPVR